jgi:ABC-type bacteriocin/lantibiotic exporter with double-glycine peptidase domain
LRVCHKDGVEEEMAVIRKSVVYLAVLVVLVYTSFLLVQTEVIGNGHHLVRISQLDPRQYATVQEYRTWAYSTCSTAAMTEIANYYSGSYRMANILAVESRIGEITPDRGLLEDAGIAHTMAHFGFKTSWGYARSLDQILALANEGTPVIVAFPPARYPGGHLLVVTGGDDSRVEVADSSVYNRTSFSRTRFLALWAGFAAVVTPQGG